jgi:hypothetical protein
MGTPRDSDRDEQIKRLLLEGTAPKVICDKLAVSLATIGRRRRELEALAVQSQTHYDRHQQQLIAVAQRLQAHVHLPEPGFMRIEDLQARHRQAIESEMRGATPFLSIPAGAGASKSEFFGRQVEIVPCFQAHTQNTPLWTQFDRWSQRADEYIEECYTRMTEIKQKVSANRIESIPLAIETSREKDALVGGIAPERCLLPMFWWTIYSYPLRDGWPHSRVKYATTTESDNAICLVSVCCDVDACSPTAILRSPSALTEQLIGLHQRLLRDYGLAASVQHKYQESAEIAEGMKKALSIYVAQESVPGSCSLCADWVRKHTVRGY